MWVSRVRVFVHAQSTSAPLWRWRSSLRHLRLFRPAPAPWNARRPQLLRAGARQNSYPARLLSDRIRRDAGARTPPRHGTEQRRSFEDASSVEATSLQEPAPKTSRRRFARGGTLLAETLLRFQRLERKEDHGEAELHASESSEPRLVVHPRDWRWSSWSHYLKGEKGLISIDRWNESADLILNPHP